MILWRVHQARFPRRPRELKSLSQVTHSLRNHILNVEWQAGKHTCNEFLSFYYMGKGCGGRAESGYEFLDGNEAVNPTPGPVLCHYRDTCLSDIQSQNENVWDEVVTKTIPLPTPYIRLYDKNGSHYLYNGTTVELQQGVLTSSHQAFITDDAQPSTTETSTPHPSSFLETSTSAPIGSSETPSASGSSETPSTSGSSETPLTSGSPETEISESHTAELHSDSEMKWKK